MGLFDKFKELSRKVSEVEHNIYTEKKDFLEIYERNLELEKEIAERTEELADANKKMFTLQHIWEMMNSSTPLENVMEAVVNSTQGELGYMHCVIISKNHDDDGDFLRVVAQSKDSLIERLNNIMGGSSIQTRRLNYDDKSVFADTLNNRTIIQTRDIDLSLRAVLPELSTETIEQIITNQPVKSVIVIPLIPRNNPFGWFCVFSSREELASSETDFLGLFAKQIEMAITIADLFQEVREQAVTDPLTGLYNRRYFEENLAKEVERSKRLRQPFSIIGVDLDHLKQINDTYGHAYGDIAIKTIANIIKKNARSIDICSRIGGEEFDILLPGINSEGAKAAAERIRVSIAEQTIDTIGHITGSFGVSTYFEHTENIDELLELADQAMYESKRKGRNRVTIAKPVSETSWQDVAVNTFIDILSKNRIPLAKKLSEELYVKLKPQNKDEISQESIFAVADMLNKLYNPMHQAGIVKNKVLIASSLAKRFDLPKDQIDNLKVAVLLYDIGNLLIPQELLQKPLPLTDEEKAQIKNHPLIAAKEILKPISYIQDVIPIIEHHHENWDGTGYPNNISGEEIPLASQIILIIDEYFALIEPRPYRGKLSRQDALEIIKTDGGKKWNQSLVKEFISFIEHDIV